MGLQYRTKLKEPRSKGSKSRFEEKEAPREVSPKYTQCELGLTMHQKSVAETGKGQIALLAGGLTFELRPHKSVLPCPAS